MIGSKPMALAKLDDCVEPLSCFYIRLETSVGVSSLLENFAFM